jgi:hypothetical protein
MKRFSVLLFAGFIAATAVESEGQVAGNLQQGVRVRVVTNQGSAIVGTIAAPIGDSVVLSRPREVTAFALKEISTVQVSRGKGRLKGAFIKGAAGLGIGLLSGAIIGAATYSKTDECDPNRFCLFDCIVVCSRGDAALIAGTLGGGAGLIVGTIAGLATGWEEWHAVRLPNPPLH